METPEPNNAGGGTGGQELEVWNPPHLHEAWRQDPPGNNTVALQGSSHHFWGPMRHPAQRSMLLCVFTSRNSGAAVTSKLGMGLCEIQGDPVCSPTYLHQSCESPLHLAVKTKGEATSAEPKSHLHPHPLPLEPGCVLWSSLEVRSWLEGLWKQTHTVYVLIKPVL